MKAIWNLVDVLISQTCTTLMDKCRYVYFVDFEKALFSRVPSISCRSMMLRAPAMLASYNPRCAMGLAWRIVLDSWNWRRGF